MYLDLEDNFGYWFMQSLKMPTWFDCIVENFNLTNTIQLHGIG